MKFAAAHCMYSLKRSLPSLVTTLLVTAPLLGICQTFRQIAPLPTGMNLSSVFFTSPSEGWVCGDAHTLLKTTNHGASWSRVLLPGYASEPLYDVYFLTPQLGFVTGNSADTGFDTYRTTDGGANWQLMPDFPTGGSWRYIQFPNTTTGFVGANGALVRSMDSGATWTTRSVYPDCPIIYGMDFKDANTGLVGGYQQSTLQDGIFKTNDGGLTWKTTHIGSANSVLFLTATTAVADSGTQIIRSTDAGSTWSPIGSVATGLFDMTKLDSNTIVGVSGGGDVWRSSNGGFSWSLRHKGIGDLPAVWRVRFFDALNGHVVGQGGSILETADGGLTWTTQNRGMGIDWGGIVTFSDSHVLLAGLHGYVQTTKDAGDHWNTQLLDPPIFLRDTYFTDVAVTGPESAYVVGHWQSMFRTPDGGSTWQNLSASVNEGYYANAVTFLDDKNGWLVGYDYGDSGKGHTRRTFDGGLTWVPSNLAAAGVDVEFKGRTGYVLAYSFGFYKTTDGGTTWTPKLVTTPEGDLYNGTHMSWVTGSFGYLSGFDGFLAKTANGGRTWSRIAPPGDSFVWLDVKALSLNEVWACGASQGGGNAVVMRSLDQGATWQQRPLVGSYTTPYRIAATDKSVYVTGYAGMTWHFDRGVPSSLTVSPTSAFGGSSTAVTGSVSFENPAPAGGITVSLTSSDPSAVQVPANVVVPAGSSTVTFSITHRPVAVKTRVRLTAKAATGSIAAWLTVKPPKVQSVSFRPKFLVGGSSTVSTGTLTLNAPAPEGGLTATIACDSPLIALGTATVFVPAGASTATFGVTAPTSVSDSTAIWVTATLNGSISGKITVTPPG